MEFKQKEALRYLRAKPGDKAAEILVDTVYLKLRNEVQARYILQKHAITADEAGVTLDCGVRFHSRALARHLKGCNTVLLESYCDEVQAQAETGGLLQRPRFSPGYGDWPLEEQRQLFAVLNCAKRIGLTLTDGLMMAPSKSVTAIIGLSEDAACVQNKCMTCSNINCPYRDTDIKKV